jgi:fructokinase
MTRRTVVCLGEGLVDLVCERPVATLAEADAFVPRLGGSLANIAVAAARFGADARMVGGAGDDAWGRFVRERIAAEGVDTAAFRLVPGGQTSLAFVAVSAEGEPSFAFHAGPKAERAVARSRPDVEGALASGPGVLVVGSDSLLSAAEREVTFAAADRARERGWAVLCDPNLRPARWPSEDEMRETIGALAGRATVVKCNAAEAWALTGASDDVEAGSALLEDGAEAVAITRGRDGAVLLAGDGETVEVEGVAAGAAVDATGAGDCVAGVLAAALGTGAAPADLAGPLSVAMRAAGGVIAAWGASAGLPPASQARAWLADSLAPLDNN